MFTLNIISVKIEQQCCADFGLMLKCGINPEAEAFRYPHGRVASGLGSAYIDGVIINSVCACHRRPIVSCFYKCWLCTLSMSLITVSLLPAIENASLPLTLRLCAVVLRSHTEPGVTLIDFLKGATAFCKHRMAYLRLSLWATTLGLALPPLCYSQTLPYSIPGHFRTLFSNTSICFFCILPGFRFCHPRLLHSGSLAPTPIKEPRVAYG